MGAGVVNGWGDGGGAEFAGEQVKEQAERAGGEDDEEEGPGGEAVAGGVGCDPKAGEEGEDDEVGEDLGAAPGLEMRSDDSEIADVGEGEGGEDGEGGGDGE